MFFCLSPTHSEEYNQIHILIPRIRSHTNINTHEYFT
jgi:hypothetical protein